MKSFSTHQTHKFFSAVIIGLVFGVAFFLNLTSFTANKVGASSSDNITGWAWSENIGWISFNCTTDTKCAGVQNYGVKIDPVSGNFSGLAWSENVGYISFNRSETANPPMAPFVSGTAIANYNKITGKVTGWGRVISVCGGSCTTASSEGGWDGWIRLSDDTNTSWAGKGVTISNNLFSGYAWSDSDLTASKKVGIGWIDFAPMIKGVFVGVRIDAPACILTTPGITFGPCQPLSQCTGGGTNPAVPGVRVGVCPSAGTLVQSCTVSQVCTAVTGGTCGNGICSFPETLLNCPKDCKGKVKQF